MSVPSKSSAPGEALVKTESLGSGEWLLLYVLRRWLTGVSSGDTRQWALAWCEISGAMGGGPGRAALGALERLVRVFAEHAARTISYHPPCCSLAGPDELSLLRLVAAAGSGDIQVASAEAMRMVGPHGIAPVVASAREVGAALAAGGVHLPVRAARSTAGRLPRPTHEVPATTIH